MKLLLMVMLMADVSLSQVEVMAMVIRDRSLLAFFYCANDDFRVVITHLEAG